MPLLDLSAAEALRIGNVDALALRIGNTLVWEAPAPPVDNGLMAAYNFNEASGPAIDRSGNGRDVTLATAGQRVTTAYEGSGAASGGLALAGGSSGVAVAPYNAVLDRSVTFWGYLVSSGVWAFRWQISALDSGAFGVFYNGGVLRGRFKKAGTNYDASATVGMPTATWMHFGLTYDAATGAGRLYGNGVLIASSTVAGGGLLDAADGIDVAAEGQVVGTGPNTFIVDSTRIYDRALTQAEVQADMNTAV